MNKRSKQNHKDKKVNISVTGKNNKKLVTQVAFAIPGEGSFIGSCNSSIMMSLLDKSNYADMCLFYYTSSNPPVIGINTSLHFFFKAEWDKDWCVLDKHSFVVFGTSSKQGFHHVWKMPEAVKPYSKHDNSTLALTVALGWVYRWRSSSRNTNVLA